MKKRNNWLNTVLFYCIHFSLIIFLLGEMLGVWYLGYYYLDIYTRLILYAFCSVCSIIVYQYTKVPKWQLIVLILFQLAFDYFLSFLNFEYNNSKDYVYVNYWNYIQTHIGLHTFLKFFYLKLLIWLIPFLSVVVWIKKKPRNLDDNLIK